MTKNTRFSPEVRQRAAICSIAPKIGCTAETLRVWGRLYERDSGGGDGGLSTAERQRLKELERENRELRRSNDILRRHSRHFAMLYFSDHGLSVSDSANPVHHDGHVQGGYSVP